MDLHGAGVGVPGPVSFRDGVPVAPPIMPGWDQFPVRSVLSQHLGCPVVVDNDVNIMALGEMHAGLARSVDDLLFVKIGTGIGCGIVVDGQVYRGASGSAGDIGHIRVDDDGPGVHAAATSAASRRYFSGAALARDATDGRPRRALRAAGRPARRRAASLTRRRRRAVAAATATRSQSSWSATAAAGSGCCSPGWSASSTPA